MNENNKIEFLNYLRILNNNKKFILLSVFFISIIAAVYSLIMPKTYNAYSVILPPPSSSPINGLSFAQNIPFSGLGIGQDESLDKYKAILGSRTVMQAVINKFDLVDKYEVKNKEVALKILRGNSSFEIQDEGTVLISVNATTNYLSDKKESSKASQLAAQMANYYVMKLDSINRSLKTSAARQNRIFIEKRYKRNLADLDSIEKSLENFQKKYKIVDLPNQMEAAIKAAADIKAQLEGAKVRKAMLATTFNRNHAEIKSINAEITQLNRILKSMKYGKQIDDSDLNLFPGFENAPALGIEYLRIKREMEIQNQLFKFFTQQFEQAKLAEIKETPTLQVLDKAVPPIKRSKPHRAIIVILSAFITFTISIVFVFLIESYKSLIRNIK
ncbi:MAG TPA: Wzz/FepE/Etk N-terminal domain-containing protein [Bacteroidales bacterium]|nr:Wzz/FepE/Etk N-terminal domain-containing protein [Bacteroidales bacterium]